MDNTPLYMTWLTMRDNEYSNAHCNQRQVSHVAGTLSPLHKPIVTHVRSHFVQNELVSFVGNQFFNDRIKQETT